MYRVRSTLTLSLTALCVLLAVALLRSACSGDSLALETYRLSGARVHVIRVDLNDMRLMVDIGLAARGIAHSEPFEAMVRRRAPLAAVTGTYFCTRSLIPVGTIIVGGKRIHVSCIGNTICFLESNQVRFINTGKGQDCDSGGAYCGLRTGPRLLNNGQYVLNPRREGFRSPGIFGARSRMALGLTRHNKLLLVSIATPVTFARTASVMRKLGAVDAVCLDGGSSSAMYYRGRLIRRPGRALTNIIEVRIAPASVVVRFAPVAPNPFAFQATQGGAFRTPPTERSATLCQAQPNDRPVWDDYEQVAALDAGVQRLTRGRHALVASHRRGLRAGSQRIKSA